MTSLVRSAKACCLVVGVLLVFATTSRAQAPEPIAAQIAKTYGLDSFDKVEALRYTFNGEFPGVKVSRSWVWEPKTGQISYESKDKDGKPVKATYSQSKLASEPANVRDEIDPAFVNDKYNLIFPFQAYWDGAAVKDTGTQKLPLGEGSAKQVVVDYSPGDVWDLYVGPDNRIEQFVFHRGGPRKPSLVIATWADYKKAGPLLLSLDRRGTADGKPLRVWFTNVAVKLVGSDSWLEAK